MAVTTAAVLPDDVVEVDIKGRRFHAIVKTAPTKNGGGYTLEVEPLQKGISFRTVRGRDLITHYRRLGRTR